MTQGFTWRAGSKDRQRSPACNNTAPKHPTCVVQREMWLLRKHAPPNDTCLKLFSFAMTTFSRRPVMTAEGVGYFSALRTGSNLCARHGRCMRHLQRTPQCASSAQLPGWEVVDFLVTVHEIHEAFMVIVVVGILGRIYRQQQVVWSEPEQSRGKQRTVGIKGAVHQPAFTYWPVSWGKKLAPVALRVSVRENACLQQLVLRVRHACVEQSPKQQGSWVQAAQLVRQ